jgi:hypothetical protein
MVRTVQQVKKASTPMEKSKLTSWQQAGPQQ